MRSMPRSPRAIRARARFAEYGETLCLAIENMRQLVYAFYDTNFCFGRMLKAYPAAARRASRIA